MSWIFHAAPTGTGMIDRAVTSIQSSLSSIGVTQHSHTLALWLFFAGCGVLQLCLSFLICTPIEQFWPLTRWSQRNPIAADVTYAFFVRLVLFPLVAFFEYRWLRQQFDGFFLAHSITLPSLPALLPALSSLPLLVFLINFAILDEIRGEMIYTFISQHFRALRTGDTWGVQVPSASVSSFAA